MFVNFFHELKSANVPVSLREYLSLLEALDNDVIGAQVEDFYYLSRAALVKDERNLDKFDQVFGHVFKGLENLTEGEMAEIPEEWLKTLTEKFLTEEEKAEIEALGGWEKIMEELKKRLEEQENAMKAAINGLARAARRPLARTAIIRKACVSAKTRTRISKR